MIPGQSMQFNEYCLVMYAPGSVVAAWIAPATFEAVMMLFVLYKSARYVCLFNHFESQPILQVFIRDGIWALALIVVVTVITALSYTGIICNAVISGSFYFWNLSIYSFAGSHVLLNMRQVGTRMNDFPTAYSSTIWSDLQFGPNDVSIASDNEECYDLENDFPLEVCAESDKRTFGLVSIAV
ncbi:hypothetical protein WOLCODRAFT_165505 [Wolfiporia cocos MD-104 SS10]|uniref:Uncharacterized protein n=1 Tax=Wolfiporia cocos (strain MD-104) TaxID=742152 RepID=A0A2H3JTP8_WOLCO|nr:hypothetical protein WOLCODRAFT_165505 [Wolfiporia cocos MD-104 SS10]